MHYIQNNQKALLKSQKMLFKPIDLEKQRSQYEEMYTVNRYQNFLYQ